MGRHCHCFCIHAGKGHELARADCLSPRSGIAILARLGVMSGWGCRYQLDDQCLLLRKECKPGMPGCVLYKKVTFIHEVEGKSPRKPSGKPSKRGKRS